MKINIITDEILSETEIRISCASLTPEVERIVSMLRVLDMKITGKKDGELHIIDQNNLLYVDVVDKKTFLYTTSDVYESTHRLYELEEQLSRCDFFRASKSSLINIRHIRAIKVGIDGRILVTLSNKEQLYVSRQYAPLLKVKLGVK